MAEHEPLAVTLRRLKQERDEADRRYNEALTALDQSQPRPPGLPSPPPPFDEHQITPLNEAWNIIPDPPQNGGVAGRVRGLVWRVVAPYLQRQLTFNSRLVDHLNRNVAVHRETQRAADATLAALRDHVASLSHFHARLMLYLQQITGYVDTKDRETGSGALVLNRAVSGFAEDSAKRWESIVAREQKRADLVDARMSAIVAEQDELRAILGVVQHATNALKRELERVSAASPTASAAPTDQGTAPASPDAFASALDAYKYVGFEDQFRGSREAIRARMETYVPFFEGASDVLDVGCGRGEFLDLLAARGIRARGIDLNHEMAESCRARGLDVIEGDAVGYLRSLDDESLGGLFAAQVVEHLQPGYLLRFLELAFHKLRPGGRLVLETLNPACWVAFFESYIRDITHVWPLHPETLKYLVVASGFSEARVEYRSPVANRDKLQPIDVPAGGDAVLGEVVETLNANFQQLNARMFTYLDYAIVGTKVSPRGR